MNVEQVSKPRYQNIDTLRILLMFMIVCLHYFGWGGIRNNSSIPLYNYLIGNIASILSWCAVNVFFMLSGYLSSSSSREVTAAIILKRILKIWVKVFIINFVFYLSGLIFGLFEATPQSVFCMFCPILSNQYWFITVFLLITAILPFILRLLNSMTDKEVLVLLAVLFIFDSVQPLFGHNGFGEVGYGALHAVTCVVIGYSIKRIKFFHFSRVMSLLMYFGACFAVAVVMFWSRKCGLDVSVVINYNSPFIIIAGIGLLSFFSTIKVNSHFPSKVAPFVLGIFLIQHQIVRDYLWEDVFHSSQYLFSPMLLVHWLLWASAFMIIGVLVDKGVSLIIESVSKQQIKYA